MILCITSTYWNMQSKKKKEKKMDTRKGARPQCGMLAFPFQCHFFCPFLTIIHVYPSRYVGISECATLSAHTWQWYKNPRMSMLLNQYVTQTLFKCIVSRRCIKEWKKTKKYNLKKRKKLTANTVMAVWSNQIRLLWWWLGVRKDGRWTKRRGSPPRGQGQGRSFVLCVLIGGTWDRL